ncbi:MAG TPA: sugar ABC transporter substrate-binding protein [Thiotrichales bacterium]|nr:sugar ABC transporter substrate-binding protein [Thiotrichales bacterium]
MFRSHSVFSKIAIVVLSLLISACSSFGGGEETDLPTAGTRAAVPEYLIGPGDNLKVFVWGNPDLSTSVPVRPDGRITTPLVEDVVATGKTPAQLAREMEQLLSRYIKNPVVTITVTRFVGQYSGQIRVIGQAANPQSLPYQAHMTLLDVMIAVGGLTDYAAGNRARIVRKIYGEESSFRVRLDDLIRDGDISANIEMAPGDILIIPEAWF